jgi:signal transduction histidine kinase
MSILTSRVPFTPRTLLEPLVLAGLITWLAVALSLRFMTPGNLLLGWGLLLAYLGLFVAHCLLAEHRRHWRAAVLLLEPLLALALVWLDPRPGTAQVLLVMWLTQIAAEWRPRRVVLAALVADTVLYLLLRHHGYTHPLTVTMLNVGFQAFAALCAHYAHSAETARDQLALVNADLLATRALLADSARDAERVRVARELHDVAGHKLTAMTLNLRALAGDPAFADRSEVRVSQQLASELLGDIRNVVQALRDSRGLDLATALRALAAPMPRPVLALSIAPDLQVTDPVTAETILRVVQEALTNSARHADADVVRVSLHRDGAQLRLGIEDDGHVHGALREGNGLSGMRERITAGGGDLAFGTTVRGALRIAASLPLIHPGTATA